MKYKFFRENRLTAITFGGCVPLKLSGTQTVCFSLIDSEENITNQLHQNFFKESWLDLIFLRLIKEKSIDFQHYRKVLYFPKGQEIFIFAAAFMLLVDVSVMPAAAMSMEQVKTLFRQETDRQWEEAASIQKRKFLRKMKDQEKHEDGESSGKRNSFLETQYKQEAALSISPEQGKRAIPFAVRVSYEEQTGLNWEDITEDEQQQFFNQYEMAQNSSLEAQDEQEADLSVSTEPRKRAVLFAVRTRYENQTGLSWEDATAEEQEQFLSQYEMEESKRRADEEDWKMRTDQREAAYQAKREAERADIEAKKQAREMKRQAELNEKIRKQDENRRRMEELEQKREAAQGHQ